MCPTDELFSKSMKELCTALVGKKISVFPLISLHFSVSCCHGAQPFKEACSVEFVLRVPFSSLHLSLYQLYLRSVMNFFGLCWSASRPWISLKQSAWEVGDVSK